MGKTDSFGVGFVSLGEAVQEGEDVFWRDLVDRSITKFTDVPLDEYKQLLVDDPPKAQQMLKDFMSDESVVAGLAALVEFEGEQMEWISKTIADHPEVRWTFLFLHEPAWEKPSESFKAIQALLKGRKHTFFAGHLHYYDYDYIDGY